MEPQILLAALKALLDDKPPSWGDYDPTSQTHQAWLGRAYALVQRWNETEAISFRSAMDFLGIPQTLQYNVGQIFAILNRAVGDLELQIPGGGDKVFGPGAVYDFFKALAGIISSASKSLLIVDQYMDDTIVDTYISSIRPPVSVRLLVRKFATSVKSATEKFSVQHKVTVEVRSSNQLHDRIVFVDEGVCWVLGHSIRDAATVKPTYLAPLSADVAKLKLSYYETIWNQAKPIQLWVSTLH